ncbi:peptidoglycan endopeptidase [Actinomadura darangshiensis]|uniref:Peptidoglycan endopeptidase n=1 Tax=Actinomadura darangshiensis TaxID=705336 RepID=A0A4R5A445_9ACTN|nr:peptidoglycan endopeptidase [Actinomadura darangshiensis]
MTTGGLVLTTTAAVGASVLAAGPAQAAVPQRAALVKAPAAAPGTAPGRAATAKQSRAAKQKTRAATAVKYAAKQIGDPYRYGGDGPGSWDCSGLAQGAWRKAGVKLPRTTQQIYKAVGKKVSWKGAVKGDLLFFYGGRSHVGVYAGHGYMIHAPNSGEKVKKIKLTRYYKRNFSGGVRPGL